jgi:A/G-specific adenine glycosylase
MVPKWRANGGEPGLARERKERKGTAAVSAAAGAVERENVARQAAGSVKDGESATRGCNEAGADYSVTPAGLGTETAGQEANAANKSFFSRELLAWYRVSKRDLPWRINRDPYRIWVSEIMLQQTRVDTVIPYYYRFMEKFPTIQALAEAPEEEVLKNWEGLGYYSRARNLQAGAREVASLYGGRVPDDKAAVSSLKGVGPYTTGAIMSIAFNRPEPAVDGNVMRVLSRYFCLTDDIAKPATRIRIEKLAASLIPEGAAGDFNQALMEHGAITCTPKSPGCLVCPVMAHCAGRLAGMETVLPVKTKAKPPRPETRLTALVEGTGEYAGMVLVRRRPDSGLLARMWELPHVMGPAANGSGAVRRRSARGRAAALLSEQVLADVESASGAIGSTTEEDTQQMAMLGRALADETRVLIRPRTLWMEADHVFSHIVWDVRIYLADFGFVLEEQERGSSSDHAAEASAVYRSRPDSPLDSASAASAGSNLEARDAPLPDGYRWIGPEDMKELAFPNVFLRILRAYWDEFY